MATTFDDSLVIKANDKGQYEVLDKDGNKIPYIRHISIEQDMSTSGEGIAYATIEFIVRLQEDG